MQAKHMRAKKGNGMKKRLVLIVLDSLGVGALPDAGQYGDAGANTLGHIMDRVPDIHIPHLQAAGLCNIQGVRDRGRAADSPAAAYGRLREQSSGKDTITGHWEIAGLHTKTPFQTFPQGFPQGFMKSFEAAAGRETLGNYAASGTEIIEALGGEHEASGKPIVYTSADSVFQIAAHTGTIPLEELYRICKVARDMLVGDMQVGRVIARPFNGQKGSYTRTSDRKDYAVSPSGRTMLDFVKAAGHPVHAVGKISDIFNGQGITDSIHTSSNQNGVDQTISLMKDGAHGLIFTNLVDFDSKYGHRRDVAGYAHALEEFDARLPEITAQLKEDDLLILCADHGTDPAHTGWDHTREGVPALIFGHAVKGGVDLGERDSFADIGASVCAYFDAEATKIGKSFLKEILS